MQFVPWYHTWWFILLMMFWMPPVGIILFLTSPYRARWKVLFCTVGAAYMVFVYFGLGSRLLAYLTEKPLVNTKLTEAQYRETCLNVSPEYYYRSGATDGYYAMELTVVRTVTDNESVSGEPVVYYLCRDPDDPDDPLVEILVRDCRVQGGGRFLRGDRIAVWGQPHGDGQLVVYDGESVGCSAIPGSAWRTGLLLRRKALKRWWGEGACPCGTGYPCRCGKRNGGLNLRGTGYPCHCGKRIGGLTFFVASRPRL